MASLCDGIFAFICSLNFSSTLDMQGVKCDVRDGRDVKNLVAFAQEKLKYIDIWVFD